MKGLSFHWKKQPTWHLLWGLGFGDRHREWNQINLNLKPGISLSSNNISSKFQLSLTKTTQINNIYIYNGPYTLSSLVTYYLLMTFHSPLHHVLPSFLKHNAIHLYLINLLLFARREGWLCSNFNLNFHINLFLFLFYPLNTWYNIKRKEKKKTL